MAQMHVAEHQQWANPLDVIERFVSQHDWLSDRQGDDELTVAVAGSWSDYNLWFSWRPDEAALMFACAYEMKIRRDKQQSLHSLIVLLNEKLSLGHFDLWEQPGLLLFRQALLLRGSSGPSEEQIEDLVEIALNECERHFPAIQFALWGGKSPRDAIQAAMLETVGEA